MEVTNPHTLELKSLTSKKTEMDTDSFLQLPIYTFPYKESYREIPDRAGIHLLRSREILMLTSQQLLNL